MSVLFDIVIPIVIVLLSITIAKLCYELYKTCKDE